MVKMQRQHLHKALMIYVKIFHVLSKSLLFVFRCRIYIGRRPADVKAPSLIFFPVLPGQLNCGFAGLMTCRLPSQLSEKTADRRLNSLWGKVKNGGLQNVPAGEKIAEHYLYGDDALHDMGMALSDLKCEAMQELLFFHADRANALSNLAAEMKAFITNEEKLLEERAELISSFDLEVINSRMLWFKDICWILERDVLANLQKIRDLTGAEKNTEVTTAAFRKYRKLNFLLNALDRLEVRGRDSAGIQLAFVLKNEKAMTDVIRQIRENGLSEDYEQRTKKGDLLNLSIFVSANQGDAQAGTCVIFTYKTYSIIGELGRNVADLRSSISNDKVLKCFANEETTCETTMTHTRWASVGAITEENCHPVNNHTTGFLSSNDPLYPGASAQINVVLNGDIDNYTALRQPLEHQGEIIARSITTDTKIIPLQIEKYLQLGKNLEEAFRLAVNDFEGSHAIAMTSNLEAGKMFLALRGSGQAIYVGVNEDQYMFSSELYGLVEVMPRFLKMNGEDGGQIFILDQKKGGGIRNITARNYNGELLKLTDASLQDSEITTRDIHRNGYPHFFLKEIFESSLSVKRTLRGKYRISADNQSRSRVSFNLGTDVVPAEISAKLGSGSIKNIVIIGQGTAAVAAQSVSDALTHYLEGATLNIFVRVASELSGFGLKDNLADTLVIPITQSGTTTDTNRAVAMARERGAHVISIVNRRQSDITAKSHGVFYTSDGRDVEMSVASTKAFYAQIIAGQVLALFFAQLLKTRSDDEIAGQLRHLESAPRLMDQICSGRQAVAATVKKAIGKKYWAVTGSGPNKAAADEIRIKLSELCYKTISSDIVENKKHIDLSAEPFILVCAAGNPETVMDDIVKDVAIFKAHKAAVVVFANAGDHRFDQVADAVVGIPAAPSPLPVILNTMAGHLWGYYAASAIDGEAQIFREFRGRLSVELTQRRQENLSVFDLVADVSLRRMINEFYALFNAHRQSGAFGALGGKTMTDLMLLLKYAAGKLPLQEIRQDFKEEKDLFSPYDLLDMTLGTAIDELTRPIDAIRHQAKTVTVGTSRKEKELEGIVFGLLETLQFSIKALTYRDILMIKRTQPAIAEIRGYTLYDIHHLDDQGRPSADSMIAIRTKAGIAANMKSRADNPTALMGVKRTIVSMGHAYVGRGKTDGASIMIIPLRSEEAGIGNLLLVHIRFNEALTLPEKIEALGPRYNEIRDLIDEYNLPWNDRYLEIIPLEFLFSEPIDIIAGKIKARQGQ